MVEELCEVRGNYVWEIREVYRSGSRGYEREIGKGDQGK